jgi:predicted ATP-dependent serine protease
MKPDNYEAEIAASLKRHRAENARKAAGQTHGDRRSEDSHKNGHVSREDKAGACEPKPFRQPNVSAEELMTMIFNPIKYVVPGIIVEGLTLFAGKPKVGKSWLLLHAAIAVARGGFTLGDIKCLEGDVLYCALEDNLRRLQSRMTKLMGMQPWPARLALSVRDSAACMVRAPNKRDQSTYDADYSAVCDLRDLANKHGVAIVLVHHLRKEAAEDAFDRINGNARLDRRGIAYGFEKGIAGSVGF